MKRTATFVASIVLVLTLMMSILSLTAIASDEYTLYHLHVAFPWLPYSQRTNLITLSIKRIGGFGAKICVLPTVRRIFIRRGKRE
jgi:hypothetical protein